MESDPLVLMEQLSSSDEVVVAIRAGARLLQALSTERGRNGSSRTKLTRVVERSLDAGDALCRWYTLRALASLHASSAEECILDSLKSHDALTRHSGAYAAQGHVSPSMVPFLVSMLGGDQFERMLAQLALLSVGTDSPAGRTVAVQLRTCACDPMQNADTRVASIECLARGQAGLRTINTLRSLAFDGGASDEVRAAAVCALGDLDDRDSVHAITQLSRCLDSPLLATAAAEALGCIPDRSTRGTLAALTMECSRRGDPARAGIQEAVLQAIRTVDRESRSTQPARGLHIAQMSMRGTIDVDLLSAGEGDGGGLSTLLVSLGQAFGRHPHVDQVYTVTRAFTRSGSESVRDPRIEEMDGPSSQLVRIPFGPEGVMSVGEMWGALLRTERGLRLFFASVPPLDALHARFADAGAWAAARWAQGAAVPLHFTLAPDPYVPIRSAQAAGHLSRASFAATEEREHYLYRAHILDWMVEHADGLALLPRPQWEEDLPLFFGISSQAFAANGSRPARMRVIAEGIDLQKPRRALRPCHPDRGEQDLIRHLTHHPHRQGKPALVTVGRLHEIKGMARLVEVWAGDPALHDEFNLVVVGGNLESPSEHEQRVLDQIVRVLNRHQSAASGLILLGSRPNREVARLLLTIREGIPSLMAPHGMYVCASDKEEFGLAILEAMAAELLVVAPIEGGPPTYITPGKTGFLADTRDITALRHVIRQAARIRENHTERTAITRNAQELVHDNFSINRMASELVDLYAAFAPAALTTKAAS